MAARCSRQCGSSCCSITTFSTWRMNGIAVLLHLLLVGPRRSRRRRACAAPSRRASYPRPASVWTSQRDVEIALDARPRAPATFHSCATLSGGTNWSIRPVTTSSRIAAHGIGDVLRPHQLGALRVDHLALVVRDVVVLEQVLADVEVVRLDLALRALDLAREHAALDDLALLHADALTAAPWCGSGRRRCASGCLRATGRTGSSRDRPGGRNGRAAGCRCAAIRDARCR